MVKVIKWLKNYTNKCKKNKIQNEPLAQHITESIYQNRNVSQLTKGDISNHLVNYNDKGRIPHTRSQTTMGGRRELL